MIYLDTSVLLAFTLTRTMELERYAATARLFDLISTGDVRRRRRSTPCTSF